MLCFKHFGYFLYCLPDTNISLSNTVPDKYNSSVVTDKIDFSMTLELPYRMVNINSFHLFFQFDNRDCGIMTYRIYN